MSDLYHIPNDDGKTYRLKKFVEYQHEVPSIHYRFLGQYIKNNKLSKDDAVFMCWLMSMTYNEITCILLFNKLKDSNYCDVWNSCGKNLLFGSARKHVKLNGRFIRLMSCWYDSFGKKPYQYIKNLEQGNPTKTYKMIQSELRRIPEVGRFASDLFLEMLVYLKGYIGINASEPPDIDWDNCANLSSGIYNIFYEDEKANEFDKNKKTTEKERVYLSLKIQQIQREIKAVYPEQDAEISMFIGKICSFRNLFKNARYGGYHHDRQLEWLKKYELLFPEHRKLWDELYGLRKDIFPVRFLGEINGWDGIRKERKKLWLSTGKTGVEYE